MNVVRRALAAAAISGTALAGVATVGATAAQAATKAPTHLAIKAPHAITYGTTVTVSGKLTRGRTAEAGYTVYLQERATPRGKWMTDTNSGVTAANGTVTITSSATFTKTEKVRLAYKLSTKRWLRSAVKTVKIRYSVTAAASGTGSPWTIGGVVMPANNHARVLLQKEKGKHWVTVGHAKENKQGDVSFTVKGAKNAGSVYRLVKPSAHRLLKGVSNPVTLS